MGSNIQFSDESVSCPALPLIGFYLSKYTQVVKKQCLNLSEKIKTFEMLILLKQGVSCLRCHFKRQRVCGGNYTVVDAGSSMKTVDAKHQLFISCSLAPMPRYVQLCQSEANKIHVRVVSMS